MKIGDHITFVLDENIMAIVIGRYTSKSRKEYRVAWMNNGNRNEAMVHECEVESIDDSDCETPSSNALAEWIKEKFSNKEVTE